MDISEADRIAVAEICEALNAAPCSLELLTGVVRAVIAFGDPVDILPSILLQFTHRAGPAAQSVADLFNEASKLCLQREQEQAAGIVRQLNRDFHPLGIAIRQDGRTKSYQLIRLTNM